ncbi:MAG TPA: DJ-1/PfpI family protein [Streptosporangiaceae bacterium]|nr:DJ-1/PfpI family protein [Streptosporangiaceae bacterium]
MAAGFTLDTPVGLERLDEADLVAVPAIAEGRPRLRRQDYPEPLLAALRRTVARGGRVLSVCTGAFVLGAAGLLDGRRCTTHWRNVSDLALCCPAADVDPSVLYVDADPVITSAGTAAGIDACLYLVRKEHGSKVANAIARRMVVPPHRDGGQAQYIDRPLPTAPADSLAEVIGWMEGHLDQQVTVGQLAARAHVAALVRPPVRPGNRDHPAPVAHRSAHPARPAVAGRDRRDGGCRRRAGRVRERDRPAPPLPHLEAHHTARVPARVPPRRRRLEAGTKALHRPGGPPAGPAQPPSWSIRVGIAG